MVDGSARQAMRIYVVTHKAESFPSDPIFQPIQSGRALNPVIPDTIGDDTGDNISRVNPYFAEIAPMYWAWKNAEPTERIGFFHYRRFLNFGLPLSPNAHWMDRNFHDFSDATCQRFGWNAAAATRMLEGTDLAVPAIEHATLPPYWNKPCSLYEHYRNAHSPRDINLALKVLAEVHPEDVPLAEHVMASRTGYFCHMYVMRWSIFDRYMRWLFAIFDAMQPRMDLSSPVYALETGQQRVFGFIGERFFNIFIEKMRAEKAHVKEFERLFGLIEGKPAQPTAPPTPPMAVVRRMQNGITMRIGDKDLALYIPD